MSSPERKEGKNLFLRLDCVKYKEERRNPRHVKPMSFIIEHIPVLQFLRLEFSGVTRKDKVSIRVVTETLFFL